MEISDDLLFNIVKDWQKKDISVEEKSNILKIILKEKKISQRSLAVKLGISHSTLHDWVSMRQENTKEYRQKNELEYLSSRLLFVLTKAQDLSPKAMLLLNELRSEIEVKLR